MEMNVKKCVVIIVSGGTCIPPTESVLFHFLVSRLELDCSCGWVCLCVCAHMWYMCVRVPLCLRGSPVLWATHIHTHAHTSVCIYSKCVLPTAELVSQQTSDIMLWAGYSLQCVCMCV